MANYGTRRYGTSRTSTSMRSGHGGWGKTASSSHSYAGKKRTGYKTVKSGGSRGPTTAPGYNQIHSAFSYKIQSYRTLWDQTRGTASKTRPTPATLKTFANWIDKGAYVWRITNSQINKWCHTNQTYKTNSAVKKVLCNKFGKNTIKAVCCAKSGGYIVATAPTWKGKPFKFPY